MRVTVAGTTPATRPGRPEWAAPTIPSSGATSSTGTQSAARTISVSPGDVATMPSACGRSRHSWRGEHHLGPVHLVEVAEHVAGRELGQQPAVVLGLGRVVVAGPRSRG